MKRIEIGIAAFVIAIVVLFGALGFAGQMLENQQMRACVEAGKSWVDDPDNIGVNMECR